MNPLFEQWTALSADEQGLSLLAMAMEYSLSSRGDNPEVIVMSEKLGVEPLGVVVIARGDKAAELLDAANNIPNGGGACTVSVKKKAGRLHNGRSWD